MSARRCRLCGSAATVPRLEWRFGPAGAVRRFWLCRCARCGIQFTHPRTPKEMIVSTQSEACYAYADTDDYPAGRLRDMMRKLRAAALKRDSGETGIRRWAVRCAAHLLRRRWAHLPAGSAGGRLLDVGCGAGAFLLWAKSVGWDVAGIDRSSIGAGRARERGLDVHCGSIEDAPWPGGSFDLVRMSHVLEHMEEPQAALESARRLLRAGGRLIIRVPDVGSWVAAVMRRRWFAYGIPEHCFHFTEATLVPLIQRAGFQISAVEKSHMFPTFTDPILSLTRWLAGPSWDFVRWSGVGAALFLEQFRSGDEIVVSGEAVTA